MRTLLFPSLNGQNTRTPFRERIDWIVIAGTIVGLLMLLLFQGWYLAASEPSASFTNLLRLNPGSSGIPPP